MEGFHVLDFILKLAYIYVKFMIYLNIYYIFMTWWWTNGITCEERQSHTFDSGDFGLICVRLSSQKGQYVCVCVCIYPSGWQAVITACMCN